MVNTSILSYFNTYSMNDMGFYNLSFTAPLFVNGGFPAPSWDTLLIGTTCPVMRQKIPAKAARFAGVEQSAGRPEAIDGKAIRDGSIAD